jgi:predicted nuclease with TOPRIM domain
MLGWALAIGAVKGAFNWYTSNEKRKDSIADYEDQLTSLNIDNDVFKSNLKMSHDETLTTLSQNLEANSMEMENAQENQKSSLASGSKVSSESSKLMNIEYASLLDSVKQNTCTAIAIASNSGFRMASSANNLKKFAQKDGTQAISKFKIQSDLQNSQSYENVRQSYENYNDQLEGYQFEKTVLSGKVETENENYKTKLENNTLQINNKKSYINSQIKDLEDGSWLTPLGGAIGLGSDMFSSSAPYWKKNK